MALGRADETPSVQKRLRREKLPAAKRQSPASTAPMKMGEPSFYTRERLAVYTKICNTEFLRNTHFMSVAQQFATSSTLGDTCV